MVIDVDVDGITQLEYLDKRLASLHDKTVNVDVDADRVGTFASGQRIGDLREGFSIDDKGRLRGPDGTFASPAVGIRGGGVSPTTLERMVKSLGVADGGGAEGAATATADGGDGDTMPMDELVRRSMETFGDAFDEDALVNRADRIHFPRDLLEGDLSDFIDADEAIAAMFDDSSDVSESLLKNLTGGGEEAFDALDVLRREGIADLPTRRFHPLRAISEDLADNWSDVSKAFRNFDATTINNLYASLVPLLIVFVGALPAAIAGLAALAAAALTVAGAFAGVGALGALAIQIEDGESLSDVASELRDSFVESFRPLAEQMQPTFEAAVDSIQQFFGELARHAGGLRQMREDALAALDAFEGMIVHGVAELIAFARAATPLMGALADMIGDLDIPQTLAGILADTMPAIIQLGAVIMELLPIIYQLSQGFLDVATFILMVLTAFGKLISLLPGGLELFGRLVGILLVLITVLSWLTTLEALYASTIAQQTIGSLVSYVATLQTVIATKLADIGVTYASIAAWLLLGAAIATVIGIMTLGIGAVAGLAGSFSLLNGKIGRATSRLKEFSRQRGRLGGQFGAGGMGGGRSPYVNYTDNSQTVIRAPDQQTGTSVAKRHNYRTQKFQQLTT